MANTKSEQTQQKNFQIALFSQSRSVLLVGCNFDKHSSLWRVDFWMRHNSMVDFSSDQLGIVITKIKYFVQLSQYELWKLWLSKRMGKKSSQVRE